MMHRSEPHSQGSILTAPEPIEPRLLPTAAAMLDRLKSRLRTACHYSAVPLEEAVRYVRTFIASHDSADARKILDECESALAGIREIAVSEVFDITGFVALQKRLNVLCKDIDALYQEAKVMKN